MQRRVNHARYSVPESLPDRRAVCVQAKCAHRNRRLPRLGYLAFPESVHIVGTELVIDGGMSQL
jgi:hypothetical protein